VSTGALYLLAQFQDPTLARQTLEYAVSGKVRNQDAFILLLIEMQIPETRDAGMGLHPATTGTRCRRSLTTAAPAVRWSAP
jgi:hypothetical protein